jgi:hypothetical protein
MSSAAKVGGYSSVRRPANGVALGRVAGSTNQAVSVAGCFQPSAGVSGSRGSGCSDINGSSGTKARVYVVMRAADGRGPGGPFGVLPLDPLSSCSSSFGEVAEFVLPDTPILATAKEALDDSVVLLQ